VITPYISRNYSALLKTQKEKIIILGSVHPPFMGPTIAPQIILNSKLNDEFVVIHLDTSDHRPISTLNKIDFMNIYLVLKHYVMLLWLGTGSV
jgi:hypothetical protein